MHKKIENDLMSLAHSILQMKNKEDVFALRDKVQVLYEKVSLLAFVEEYVNTTPNLETSKEELIDKVTDALRLKNKEVESVENENTVIHQLEDESPEFFEEEQGIDLKEEVKVQKSVVEENVEELIEVAESTTEEIEQPFEEIEELIFGENEPKEEKQELNEVVNKKGKTLEEELEDTIPVDVMADLFEPLKQASLNDVLQTNIQIGLNDRIAFVKNLFNESQEDFNRVVSQLNTIKSEKEAKKFINKMVKPDYNWSEHEELENRFMEIVLRKFA